MTPRLIRFRKTWSIWQYYGMRGHHHLIAWQKAKANALAVHLHCERSKIYSRQSTYDQAKRASLSVQLNIAEGNSSGPGRRCRYLTLVAYGSAVETTEILDLLSDLGEDVKEMIDLSREVQALTLGLWKSLKK